MSDIATGLDIIDRLNAERNARIADSTKMQSAGTSTILRKAVRKIRLLPEPPSRICPIGGPARTAATESMSSFRFWTLTTHRSSV